MLEFCGLHMRGHMLARNIMRTSYFWLTMEIDCFQFVHICSECEMHRDLIHVRPSRVACIDLTLAILRM